MERKLKSIIGRAEIVALPDANIESVNAKIDTGAHRSSIDTSFIEEKDDILSFTLLREGHPAYNGVVLTSDKFRKVTIYNSFGHGEERYEVKMRIKIGNRRFKTGFTLADRSKKTYPILIGRKLLKDRYLVDVSEGVPHEDDKES